MENTATSSPMNQNQWSIFVTRPFNIFGASILHYSYTSEKQKQIFGMTLSEGLFIEHFREKDISYYFRRTEEYANLLQTCEDLMKNNPSALKNWFLRGKEMCAETEEIIKKGPGFFKDVFEALDYFVELFLLATNLPYYMKPELLDESIFRLAKDLRFTSYYPKFMKKILAPLTINYLCANNMDIEDLWQYITIPELMSQHFAPAIKRLSEREKGNRFVFHAHDSMQNISWIPTTKKILTSLLGNDMFEKSSDNTLHGMTAYPGLVIGKAFVVLQYDYDNTQEIEEDSIIVSINANPNLTPRIMQCKGLITDEGATMCHAAIIAREQKIPCIVGTRAATNTIKTGDIVEMDANSGIVRILS